jgi:hypothetical protein
MGGKVSWARCMVSMAGVCGRYRKGARAWRCVVHLRREEGRQEYS